jgi:hypothetical protein
MAAFAHDQRRRHDMCPIAWASPLLGQRGWWPVPPLATPMFAHCPCRLDQGVGWRRVWTPMMTWKGMRGKTWSFSMRGCPVLPCPLAYLLSSFSSNKSRI